MNELNSGLVLYTPSTGPSFRRTGGWNWGVYSPNMGSPAFMYTTGKLTGKIF